jgi:drug/metabolite transporter (DMT)-like permease
MKNGRLILLTLLALLAFAGNSILCRFALKETAIDPATFTLVRIISGAVLLWIVTTARKTNGSNQGGWFSATALFLYAAGFSFAYTQLSAGTGALLLFGAVQATMIIWGFFRGERLHVGGAIGLAFALCGLVGLTWPGVSTPPLLASCSMLAAGIAWGVYSLRGRSIANPLQATAANFLRAAPLAILLSGLLWNRMNLDRAGVVAAIVSGAITSGLGYVIWYAVVPELGAIRASIVQLCVPVLAAGAGIAFLNETLSTRVTLAAAAILGGVALALVKKSATSQA